MAKDIRVSVVLKLDEVEDAKAIEKLEKLIENHRLGEYLTELVKKDN